MPAKRPKRLRDDIDLEAVFLGKRQQMDDEEDFERMLDEYLAPEDQESFGCPLPSRASAPGFQMEPQEQLDLHGLRREEAIQKLDFFIQDARYRGLRCVKVITGKGLQSLEGPVLKDAVEEKMVILKREGVISHFKWEKKKKTKSGAIIAVL